MFSMQFLRWSYYGILFVDFLTSFTTEIYETTAKFFQLSVSRECLCMCPTNKFCIYWSTLIDLDINGMAFDARHAHNF
jgi:hypothetical protein